MWIALETSGDRASVAIGLPDGRVAEELISGTRRHAIELVPALERVMRTAQSGLERVAGVLISNGPGSFTGLRIGATVAKALARVHHCPLRVASALSVIARGAWLASGTGKSRVLAVTDALRGEVYAALYDMDQAAVEVVIPPAVLTPVELARWPVADHVGGNLELPGLAGTRISGEAALPRASVLLELLAIERATSLVHGLETWEPDYGRPAEAQARWEAAHGRRLPDSTGTAV